MTPIQYILAAFFLANAIFWGLFPHASHCAVAAMLGVTDCPSHWLHISSGVVFFLVTVVICQFHMFRKQK